MRYMLLIYTNENAARTPEETAAVIAGHEAVLGETARRGILLGADPLEPTSTATTVRKRDGKTVIVDGPFAETKEQLAGYYILDCKDLDEALEWATRIPTACGGGAGCIEVRPIRTMARPELLAAETTQA
ncbi:MAG TPA: YciI family protein [Terriglobales bacterium]|nr:YciI family protein [Terriglobales bacterium]